MSATTTTSTSTSTVAPEPRAARTYDVDAIRRDFPILSTRVYGKPLVYLDNAASAQKPMAVIEAEQRVYESLYANIHRGVHYLSVHATDAYDAARETARAFLNAESAHEIIFVRGTTEAVNLGTCPGAAPPSGTATACSSVFNLGPNTLGYKAIYSGDGNFTSATSAPATIGIGSPVVGDFAIAANGTASQTVAPGNSASFSFAVEWQGTPLASPIMLSAAGLPPLAKASFSPAYLPPGASNSTFTLTVSTAGTTASRRTTSPFALALLLLPIGFTLRGRLKVTTIFAAIFLTAMLTLGTGCGDRINTAGLGSSSATPYIITVTGTATTPSGTTVAHSATVTLVVQKSS